MLGFFSEIANREPVSDIHYDGSCLGPSRQTETFSFILHGPVYSLSIIQCETMYICTL